MGINYKRLWKLLIDKDMTKTELRKQTEIASSTLFSHLYIHAKSKKNGCFVRTVMKGK